jgi:hypothetical protein
LCFKIPKIQRMQDVHPTLLSTTISMTHFSWRG